MRHLIVLATILLAGCGSAATLDNQAAGNTAVANAAAASPPANALPPAGGNATAAADTRRGPSGLTRPEMLEECASQAEAMLPGVEPGPLCTCAVDRVLDGAQRRDAVRQCAAALNIRLPID